MKRCQCRRAVTFLVLGIVLLQTSCQPPQNRLERRVVGILWLGSNDRPMPQSYFYSGPPPDLERSSRFDSLHELSDQEMATLVAALTELGKPRSERPICSCYSAHLETPEATGWIRFETSLAGAADMEEIAQALPEEKRTDLAGIAHYIRLLAEHYGAVGNN